MDIIALIEDYVSGLLLAEEKFLEHLDAFSDFEEAVSDLSNRMAADFIGLSLTNADRLIRESGSRKKEYTVQRCRQRTLISTVGDITFSHTLYKGRDGKTHCLLDEMIRMKEAGKIRNLGFSFHGSYEDFAYILNYRDWDFCQIQYNYMDTDIQAGDRGVALAAERKVPLIIMEPVKGGSLASFAPAAEQIFKDYAPEKSLASWAVRWVAAHPGVAVVLSGMSTEEQVRDNLDTFNHYVIDRVIEAIRGSIRNGCTGCAYCMPCPFGVDIPRNFAIWNEYGMYNNAERTKENLARLDAEKWADKCRACGKCEKACPQALPIREDLKRMFAEVSAL